MRTLFFHIGMATLFTAGCGGTLEAQSGPDAHRHQAAPAVFNAWIPDEISRTDEDATDWKSFQISAATPVTIQVQFTDPDVKATVSLHDIHGMPVARKSTQKGQAGPLMLTGPVPPGMNFIRIHCTGGSDASEYALQIALGDSSGTPPRPF
jgi:hypothetical protein